MPAARSSNDAPKNATLPVPRAKPNPLFALAAPALAIAVFALTTTFGFTSWDDGATLTANPHITQDGGFAALWTSGSNEQYYPLTWTVYWLEFRLFGLAPAGFHAVNVLLHALNAWLVWRLFIRLGIGAPGSTLAALLFAIHPVQVMSVAWVAELKNLLSGAFTLSALLLWTRPGRSRRAAASALGLFVLALLAKSAVLGLPVILAVYERFVARQPLRKTLLRVAPFFAIACASALPTFVFEQKFVATSVPLPLLTRPLIAASGLLFYGGKLVLPILLSPIYSRWDVNPESPLWWVPLLLVVAAGAALFRHRELLTGRLALAATIFVGFLFPSLGFVNFGNLALTFVSDHYLYLAILGPCLLASLGFERLLSLRRTRRCALGLAALLVVSASVRTIVQLPVWTNATTMWTATLAANPRCFAAHYGLAQESERRGDFNAAARSYRAAAAAMPFEADAWLKLGEMLLRSGDPESAEGAFRTLRDQEPGIASAHFGLGAAAEAQRQFPEAEGHYRRGLELAPDDAVGHLRLAGLYLGLLRRDDAAPHFELAAKLRPDDPWPRLGLATVRRGQGRHRDAVEILSDSLSRAPDDVPTLNLLARILASCPEDGVRNGASALALASRAVERTAGRDPRILETLAAALAESGRFEDAIKTAEAARRLASPGALAEALQMQLDRYRRREPFREVPPSR